ncbi:hypothetical protein Cgig2_001733 [Carnegiea gigantea]|uniref:Uncharacterized protein n=1 Tax=Carnegiea gigantea TaxID=171969 RepID=A0A9Q1GNY1_9CARY|nr:hypothetical protein Cgig2_001733 [Carnegiea gigantea]
MNASKFMDKQIMDLSRSKGDLLSTTTPTNSDKKTNDFIDLMNPNPQSEEDSDGGSSSLNNDKKDEILPSYDFHPIPRPGGGGGGGGGVSASLSSSDAPAAAATTSPRAASRAWTSLDSKPNSSTLRDLMTPLSVTCFMDDGSEEAKPNQHRKSNLSSSIVKTEVAGFTVNRKWREAQQVEKGGCRLTSKVSKL